MPRRKIPTKAELIRLQKLYKTDEKIAERLGNVTPQLVAYWRRKKNIQKYSFPKFSYDEIRDLWERFGDDYRCGLELGISKAAFYNWRRKYNIKQKPAFLKLEQLELNLGETGRGQTNRPTQERQTIAQKIIAELTEQDKVEVGEEVEVEPDLAMIQDDAADVIEQFYEQGLTYVWNPNRIVISISFNPCSEHEPHDYYKIIRDFVKRQNIKYFYDINEGGCHQVVVEKGRILPGQLAVSTVSGCSSYGSIGAIAFQVDKPAMTELWSSKGVRVTVPETIKIVVNGKVPAGIFAKDIGLFIAKKLSHETLKGKIIEFNGTAVSSMSISERFTLTNIAQEMGAVSAVCAFDSITRRYLLRRTKMPYRPALADKNAEYNGFYEFNVETLEPQVTRPGGFENTDPVAGIIGTAVDQIIIGSCSNGRFDDLRIAADILKGKRIHRDVRLIIIPGSRAVYLEALRKGLIRALIESGAVIMSPGCGYCNGSRVHAIATGEKCLATFSSTQESTEDHELFLASPATAAVTALKGVITDPTSYFK